MEAPESEPKKRVLPLWMRAQESPRPAKTPKKRKAAAPASATSHSTVRTVYCMSESELVDVALGILLEGRQQEASPAPPCLEGADKPEDAPLCFESSSSPSTSGSGSEDEDTRKVSPDPGRRGLPSSGEPGTSESACHGNAEEDDDDDVLKYVREIFFS